jgi:hypothetical protein
MRGKVEIVLKHSSPKAFAEWCRLFYASPQVLLMVFCLLPMGCRSRAYQDVYADQLASELRLLEDQLYEADYQNQILRQKLHRDRQRAGDERTQADPLHQESGLPSANPKRRAGTNTLKSPRNASDDSADIGDSDIEIDLGEPTLPAGDLPPVQVAPPRMQDFAPPPIELGEPLPPGGDVEKREDLPAGQIPTPESARLLLPPEARQPVAIKIHPGLSGGHHQDSDQELDGLMVVLTLADPLGEPCVTDLPISIVVLDPTKEGEAARMGRWNFSSEQVTAACRETPLKSLQFPLLWQDSRPAGDEVAVFVRVMIPGSVPLETDMMLRFRDATTADWQPAGLGNQGENLAKLRDTVHW